MPSLDSPRPAAVSAWLCFGGQQTCRVQSNTTRTHQISVPPPNLKGTVQHYLCFRSGSGPFRQRHFRITVGRTFHTRQPRQDRNAGTFATRSCISATSDLFLCRHRGSGSSLRQTEEKPRGLLVKALPSSHSLFLVPFTTFCYKIHHPFLGMGLHFTCL